MEETDLRKLIVQRICSSGANVNGGKLLDAYNHLLHLGIPPDNALQAMDAFVNDVIALKRSSKN